MAVKHFRTNDFSFVCQSQCEGFGGLNKVDWSSNNSKGDSNDKLKQSVYRYRKK